MQKFNAYTIDEKYTQQYVYKDILFSYKQFQLQEQRQYNMYKKIISYSLPSHH